MHFDIVVLGGGPAGGMAAIAAKKANPALRVALIDQNERAGHRIGEALLTGTVMTFKELGIDEQIRAAGYHRKIGAAYVWGNDRKPWYVNYPGLVDGFPESFMHEGKRCAIHVPRHIFDQQLRDIAGDLGVEVFVKELVDVKATQTKVLVSVSASDGSVFTASQWIDATGQRAFIGRKLSERRPVWATRVARYAYFDDLDWARATDAGFDLHRTNIISHENGWNWVIHLGEAGSNLTSVGVVTTPDVANKLTLTNAAEAFEGLKDFGLGKGLQSAKDYLGRPMDKFYGHPDYSYQTLDLDGPNWALAGDAALFIDPILSQGVTLACHYGMLRGRAAVAAISGDGQAQQRVTQHYRNESEVLKVVVGEWYSNNRAVPRWKWKASEIANGLGFDYSSDREFDAFRYVTNLENLREEYDPYPREVTKRIWDHLLPKE